MSKFSTSIQGKFSEKTGIPEDLFKFKNVIFVPADFPTLAEVQVGWFYIIGANVTDNDVTKTNTGQSFLAGDEIVWNGTNWTLLGATTLWGDDLTNLSPINSRNINIATGQIYKINNENIFTRNNPELTTTDKAVFGAINENFDKLEITNGSILETISLVITSNGAIITASLSAAVGTDLHFVFSNGIQTVDVTSPMTATLTAGSDTSPQENWLYVLKSDPTTLVVSTVDFPSDLIDEYAPIGRIIVQSAATVLADGVLKQHNYTDHIKADGGIGHLHDMTEWIREQWATWISGVAQTVTGGGTGTVTYAVSSGTVRQLHLQAFPAFIDPATLYIINDSVTPYIQITNIGGGILLDSLGGTLNNRYYNLVIWGVCSKEGSGESKLFINLPSGSYATQNGAESDSNRFTNYGIPSKYKGTGFLIQRILFRNNASTTYTVANTEDLRGQFPNTVAGTSIALGTQFPDNVFEVFNNADNTKVVDLDVSNVTTGNTRTITIADRDLDLANPSFDTIKTDIINELTSDNGILIEDVNLIDGKVNIGFSPKELVFGNIASAPYAWYHLNSSAGVTVYDSSGFGRDGSTVNMDDSNWVPGKLNNCLQFNGTDEYVNLGAIANFERTDLFSVEKWIKLTTHGIIEGKNQWTAPFPGWYVGTNASGHLQFVLTNTWGTNQLSAYSDAVNMIDNVWHHFIVTYDGSSNLVGVKFRIDGSLRTTKGNPSTLTGSILNTTNAQIAGADGINELPTGLIDEGVIYPYVVTAPDAAARWNGGAGTEVLPGFANLGRLSLNSATSKMTQQYGGDCEIVTTISGSKISLTPPADGGVEVTDGIFRLPIGTNVNEISTDITFASASNNQLATALAIKTYVDNSIAPENLWYRDTTGTPFLRPEIPGDDVKLGIGDLSALNVSAVSGSELFGLTPGYGIIKNDGTVLADTTVLEMQNQASAPSMTNTTTSILFKQKGENTTVQNEGKILFGAEGNWDLAASTRDSYYKIQVVEDGVLGDGLKIASNKDVTLYRDLTVSGDLTTSKAFVNDFLRFPTAASWSGSIPEKAMQGVVDLGGGNHEYEFWVVSTDSTFKDFLWSGEKSGGVSATYMRLDETGLYIPDIKELFTGNGVNIQGINIDETGADSFEMMRGTTDFNVTADCTIDQDLSTTSDITHNQGLFSSYCQSDGFRVLNNTVPATGEGIEITYRDDIHEGFLASYDRTGAAFKPINIHGSEIRCRINSWTAGDKMLIDSSGVKIDDILELTGANGVNIQGINIDETGANVFQLVRGTTGLYVNTTCTINQGLSTVDDITHNQGLFSSYCQSQGFRALNNVIPVTGAGIELQYETGTPAGFVSTYNRGTSTFLTTNIVGSQIGFRIDSWTVDKAAITSNGLEVLDIRGLSAGDVVFKTDIGGSILAILNGNDVVVEKYLTLHEHAVAAAPADGYGSLYIDSATGDLKATIQHGSVTKTATIVDFSAI